MVTRNENGLVRVTVTLDPRDVELLDALAEIEGLNRSAELRSMLSQVRPMMEQIVKTAQTVNAQRAALDEALLNARVSELELIGPELEDIANRFIGAMAKLEGLATANAPASNTGATNS